MTKVYNTPEYRDEKRVVSFVPHEVKKAILKSAKKNNLSVSSELRNTLTKEYLKK